MQKLIIVFYIISVDERISVSTVAALINDKLAPLAMSVKSGICEMTGDTYWSVVGTSIEEGVT